MGRNQSIAAPVFSNVITAIHSLSEKRRCLFVSPIDKSKRKDFGSSEARVAEMFYDKRSKESKYFSAANQVLFFQ